MGTVGNCRLGDRFNINYCDKLSEFGITTNKMDELILKLSVLDCIICCYSLYML